MVLYYAGDQLTGNTKKLTTNWIGPHEIIKISNDNLSYKLSDVNNPDNYIRATINQIKIFKPKAESMNIEKPLDLVINYISQMLDNERLSEVIDYEINMMKQKKTEEYRNRFHELTVYDPFSNNKMNKYKYVFEKITSPNINSIWE